MGLMYILPVKEEDSDRVVTSNATADSRSISVRSYGLPYVFWFYWIAMVIVLAAMALAVYAPVSKMLAGGDWLNQLISASAITLVAGLPIFGLGMLFFEIRINKSGSKLEKHYRLFGLPIWKKKIELRDEDPFMVEHHLDSPNVAKIEGNSDYRAFQNHGHYHLFAVTNEGKAVLLDRHSRKSDLARLASLLMKF